MNRQRPPASLVLVHGAGSGPEIYRDWPISFPGLAVMTVDLHGGLDVARASHAEYVTNLVHAVAGFPRPLALCGWSMGGLVVLQAAAQIRPVMAILIEPSPPAEVQPPDASVLLETGTFDPQELYGPFPPGVPARLESALARAERKRGISVPWLACSSLVVYGDEFRLERGVSIARFYGSEELYFPGLDHWGLICEPRVREAIAAFLGSPGEHPSTR